MIVRSTDPHAEPVPPAAHRSPTRGGGATATPIAFAEMASLAVDVILLFLV
jgi:hypothetical protein